MLYGHRRDVEGFGRALEVFDQGMPAWTQSLTDRDLVLVTADHGNDPTYKGTDHTREYIPMLAYSKLLERTRSGKPPVQLGDRDCFGDLGMTVVKALKPELLSPGSQLLRELEGKDFLGELGV